jgi:hypothetical protein
MFMVYVDEEWRGDFDDFFGAFKRFFTETQNLIFSHKKTNAELQKNSFILFQKEGEDYVGYLTMWLAYELARKLGVLEKNKITNFIPGPETIFIINLTYLRSKLELAQMDLLIAAEAAGIRV